VAHLRRQLDRLVSSQQSLASQLRSEVADGLRASEAAVAARVEAAVVKALNKRAEDERRRAKDLEKALTQQITQVRSSGQVQGLFRRQCCCSWLLPAECM
jgi:hypothetical protein